MQIFVNSSVGNDAFNVNADETVEVLKASLAERTGLKGAELAYKGRVLEDICRLQDYDLEDQCTLEAYVPMLGGQFSRFDVQLPCVVVLCPLAVLSGAVQF